MNTLLTALIIIAIVIIIIQYVDGIKLQRTVDELTKGKVIKEKQKQDIIKITVSLLTSLLNKNGILPNDRIPFVINHCGASNAVLTENLDSVRFRLKDDNVLTYINGQIAPTKELVEIDNITSLDYEQYHLVTTLLEELKSLDKSSIIIPLTPGKIINILNN